MPCLRGIFVSFSPSDLKGSSFYKQNGLLELKKKIKVIQTKITQSTVEAGTTHITRVSEYSRSMKSGKCDTFRENY